MGLFKRSDEFLFQECRDFEIVVKELKKYISDERAIDKIRVAYEFAADKHAPQKRRNGEPYIIHPLSAAYYLAQWKMGPQTIMAGLLHDIIEDTPVTYQDLQEKFGTEVANLVETVTKVTYFTKENREQIKASYLRKLYFSMVLDVRVLIIKIADRMHNMLTLQYLRPEKQLVIAKETLEVYSAIAHRIGMKVAKSYLEDYSFKYLEPDKFKHVENLVEHDEEQRIEALNEAIKEIRENLKVKMNMNVLDVFGRSKTIYSIYRKMDMFGKLFSEIHDILAVRIIVKTIEDCYLALGYIHQFFTPLQKYFKDYVATPKNNLYQSLHTTIIDQRGTIFEIQIRTKEMDEIAETGIAAHWRYKGLDEIDIDKKQKELDEKIDLFNKVLDLEKYYLEEEDEQKEIINTTTANLAASKNLEKNVQNDFFSPSIFVLTPMGKVVTLPFGSTVLDFAYRIHSRIGDKTIGAKINGTFSPLNAILKSGEIVEIETSEDQEPHKSWLKFTKTSLAKNTIKKTLENRNADEKNHNSAIKDSDLHKIRKVKNKIFKYIRQNDLKWNILSDTEIAERVNLLNYATIDEFVLAVDSGKFSIKDAVENVYTNIDLVNPKSKIALEILAKKQAKEKNVRDVVVNAQTAYYTTLAKCCYPIPGDPIKAVKAGNDDTFSIHRLNCPRLVVLKEKLVLFDCAWNEKNLQLKYETRLLIEAFDRPNLLLDMCKMLAGFHCDVKDIRLYSQKEGFLINGIFILQPANYTELDQIIKGFNNITYVDSVVRE